jgi:hypothetical protein
MHDTDAAVTGIKLETSTVRVSVGQFGMDGAFSSPFIKFGGLAASSVLHAADTSATTKIMQHAAANTLTVNDIPLALSAVPDGRVLAPRQSPWRCQIIRSRTALCPSSRVAEPQRLPIDQVAGQSDPEFHGVQRPLICLRHKRPCPDRIRNGPDHDPRQGDQAPDRQF